MAKVQSIVTLSLTINSDKTKEIVKSFRTLEDLRYAYIANNIGTLVITRVPADIEYEVSKYIFNKVELYEKKKETELLKSQIFKGNR